MKSFTCIALLAASVALAGAVRPAAAQKLALACGNSSCGHSSYGQYRYRTVPRYGYAYGGFGYPGGVYNHASTYEEGVLRGVADVIRSQGSFNLNTSLANINNQQARSLAIENHRQAVETYFAVRRINREARAEERTPRPSAEDIVRFARDGARELVSIGDVKLAGDKLAWPAALEGERFAAERAAIDGLMARRSESAESNAAIRRLAAQLEARLKGQIGSLPTGEYLAAKNFVTGLKHIELLPKAADVLLAKSP